MKSCTRQDSITVVTCAKFRLWSVEYVLIQNTANFGRISNSIEISLVGRLPGLKLYRPQSAVATSPCKWKTTMSTGTTSDLYKESKHGYKAKQTKIINIINEMISKGYCSYLCINWLADGWMKLTKDVCRFLLRALGPKVSGGGAGWVSASMMFSGT